MGSLETSAATTSNLLITLRYSMPCITCPKELPLSPPALLVMFTGANVHKMQFFGEDSEARLFVLLCICVMPCITGIAWHCLGSALQMVNSFSKKHAEFFSHLSKCALNV